MRNVCDPSGLLISPPPTCTNSTGWFLARGLFSSFSFWTCQPIPKFKLCDDTLLYNLQPSVNWTKITRKSTKYRKIPKISPGANIFQRPFWGAYIRRGLCKEGNLRFKIDWASLYPEGNLPFLLCFTLYWRENSKYKPPGGLYSEERFNGGFFALRFRGLLFGGAYTWRGLFSEFYGIAQPRSRSSLSSFSRHERELWEWELECSPGNFTNDTTM